MFTREIWGCFVFIGLLIVCSVALSANSEIEQNMGANEKNSKIVLTSKCAAPASRDDCLPLDDRKYHEKQIVKLENLNKTTYKTIAPIVNPSSDVQKPEEREITNSVGKSLLSSDALALILFVFITSAILIRRLG